MLLGNAQKLTPTYDTQVFKSKMRCFRSTIIACSSPPCSFTACFARIALTWRLFPPFWTGFCIQFLRKISKKNYRRPCPRPSWWPRLGRPGLWWMESVMKTSITLQFYPLRAARRSSSSLHPRLRICFMLDIDF